MGPESSGRAALLWDESFLWGVLAVRALRDAGVLFDLVTSEQMAAAGLPARVPLLVVPGGWASQKRRKMGTGGQDAVRAYVRAGGTYFGVCGGAGLALDTRDGLGLLPAARVPRTERVPSFAGRVALRPTRPADPLWEGLPGHGSDRGAGMEIWSHVWWPSQFQLQADTTVEIMATYGPAAPGATTADLPVDDVVRHGIGWRRLEDLYQILLDPACLENEPAVIAGDHGDGRVVLSMVHFDTPGDLTGRQVLRNLVRLAGAQTCEPPPFGETTRRRDRVSGLVCDVPGVARLFTHAEALIALGQRLFLWRWRSPYLLHWRRGIRGLEFCTLYVMAEAIALEAIRNPAWVCANHEALERGADAMAGFEKLASELLVREALMLQNERMSFDRCSDPDVQALRGRLFSSSKSHGGAFKDLLEQLDRILLALLVAEP